jgi:folate-binding protein YgfZ
MLTAPQLAAARTAAAVGPVLAPAFLRFSGKDARSFLHRMSTQDLAGLTPGAAAYAAFLTSKGHLVAEGHVLARADDLLLATDPAAAPEARAHLARYVVMDDVTIEAVAELRVLPVLGPGAAAAAEGLAAAARVPDARRGVPGLDLWLPAAEAEAAREALVGRGLPALDAEGLEALRILGGQARYGPDLDAARLPMEAGLTRAAISFTKGCYIGQEIVVRATVRGQLQRGLVALGLPAGAGPGTALVAAGAEVGVVTSAAETPEGRVGLGVLRRAHWREGEQLEAAGGTAVVRRVLVEDPSTGSG